MPYPIIGADLLAFYGLSVDLRSHKLVDNLTQIGSRGGIFLAEVINVSTIDKFSSIASILAEFPTITGLAQMPKIALKGVFHHIETRGPPSAERARRLAPDKLDIAKK